MGYSVEEASKAFKDIAEGESPATEAQMRHIIGQLDVTGSGSKTILFTGVSQTVIDELAKDPNNRMLPNTEAGKFLNGITTNEAFKEAWMKVYGDTFDYHNNIKYSLHVKTQKTLKEAISGAEHKVA